jgi:hypothetical protein
VKNYRGNSSLHRNSTATSTWLEHPQERAHQARAHWQDHPELCGLGQTALMRRSSSYLARNVLAQSLSALPIGCRPSLFLLAVFLVSSYWLFSYSLLIGCIPILFLLAVFLFSSYWLSS